MISSAQNSVDTDTSGFGLVDQRSCKGSTLLWRNSFRIILVRRSFNVVSTEQQKRTEENLWSTVILSEMNASRFVRCVETPVGKWLNNIAHIQIDWNMFTQINIKHRYKYKQMGELEQMYKKKGKSKETNTKDGGFYSLFSRLWPISLSTINGGIFPIVIIILILLIYKIRCPVCCQ